MKKLIVFRCGFTFTELMVVLAIFAIIATAMYAILAAGQSSWYMHDAKMQAIQEARRGMASMVRELRQTSSTQVNCPANGAWQTGPLTFSIPQDTDGDGDTVDSAGNVEWSPVITYQTNAANQLLRQESNSSTVLANFVASFQYRRQVATPDELELSLQTLKYTRERSALGRAGTVTLDSTIRMRN